MNEREINEAVARKLGYNVQYDGIYWEAVPDDVMAELHPLPDYCTQIAAAWEVVEKMSGDYEVTINAAHRKYWCHAAGPTWKQAVHAEADTAPMAICLAFLKLNPTA